ncbi:MAG TPA: YafY family protein [Gaiellaceae bacterium]|nr:YafY family protein [Gaiellaceae bacterium]
MSTATSRLLTLLELLQDRPHATGRELADAVGVDTRTLRRYVAALKEIGIPVEGQRGVGGGYRIRPGYRLPPLMLRDEEVVAVVIGLLAARASRLPAPTEAVDGALAKIYRVLPPALQRKVGALEVAVLFSGSGDVEPVRGDLVLELADAIRRGRRVRTHYTSRDRTTSERELSPYGLVIHGGRGYLAAYDHGRAELRTFRVDRIRSVAIEPDLAATEPPPEFEPSEYVRRSLRSVPWTHEVSVLLELPPETARARLPETFGTLTAADGGSRLEARAESLDWVARVLAGLGCPFTIERPARLRTAVASLADALASSARRR